MKVLIADDDFAFRMMLRALMHDHNFEFIEARSGTEALSYIQSENAPELLFLDWNMPGYSGVELAEYIRLDTTETRPYVIMVSANNDDEHILHALASGADDYITKPVDGRFLLAKLAVAKRIIDAQHGLSQANRVLRDLAYSDELTGLFNRRAGIESLKSELERAKRYKSILAICMADIDHFKEVNDSLGHQAGDEVLKQFAHRLQKTVRPYDVCCRYGGEEFLIISQAALDRKKVQPLFERVRKSIASLVIQHEEAVINITVSMGVYIVKPNENISVEQMLVKADEALYEAKKQGRDRVIIKPEIPAIDLKL